MSSTFFLFNYRDGMSMVVHSGETKNSRDEERSSINYFSTASAYECARDGRDALRSLMLARRSRIAIYPIHIMSTAKVKSDDS